MAARRRSVDFLGALRAELVQIASALSQTEDAEWHSSIRSATDELDQNVGVLVMSIEAYKWVRESLKCRAKECERFYWRFAWE
jgi:hypothetical protein